MKRGGARDIVAGRKNKSTNDSCSRKPRRAKEFRARSSVFIVQQHRIRALETFNPSRIGHWLCRAHHPAHCSLLLTDSLPGRERERKVEDIADGVLKTEPETEQQQM